MAKARSSPPDFIKDVCKVFNVMSTFWNGKVYTIGGSAWMALGTKPEKWDQTSDSHMRVLDFSKSIENIDKPPANFLTAVRLPDSVPFLKFGSFFSTNNGTSLALYGGAHEYFPAWNDDSSGIEKDRPDLLDYLWLYDTATKKWTRKKTGANMQVVPSYANNAWDSQRGVGYTYGGLYGDSGYYKGPLNLDDEAHLGVWVPGRLQTQELQNMFKYDSKTQSITEIKPDLNPVGRVKGGELVFIPGVGKDGVLILVGGYAAGSLRPMKDINVFDIATKTWFTQPTTADGGTYPFGRIEACSVLASAKDNSSHNIYIYGGYNGDISSQESFDDVYVLSLPAFHWTLVASGEKVSRHTCQQLQNRYLLTYGGTKDEAVLGQCVGANIGTRLFDLTELKWTKKYEVGANDGKYKVPEKLYKYLGGGPDGGANITEPSNKFSDSRLVEIFKFSNNNSSQTNPGNNNTPTPSPTSSPEESNASTTAAIVGGVVGGLAFVTFLAFFILFLKRRRARRGSDKYNGGALPTTQLITDNDHVQQISTGPMELPASTSYGSPAPTQIPASYYSPNNKHLQHPSMMNSPPSMYTEGRQYSPYLGAHTSSYHEADSVVLAARPPIELDGTQQQPVELGDYSGEDVGRGQAGNDLK